MEAQFKYLQQKMSQAYTVFSGLRRNSSGDKGI